MWGCKPCSAADPTTDTVKVALPPASPWGDAAKENVAPPEEQHQKGAAEAARHSEVEEARRRAEAEAAQRRAEAEEAQRAEQAKQLALAEERKRQAAEAAARARDEAVRREQEEQRLREEAAKAERVRQEKEAAGRKKLDAFLKKHAYTGANVKRSKMCGSSYPLHDAVRENDAELVQLLVAARANPALKDSSGRTPLQLADKVNKHNSHAPVLRALGATA